MTAYKFVLSTDSTCDLYRDYIEANEIAFVPLTFTMEHTDKTMEDRLDAFTSYEEYVAFYRELRGGGFSRTSMLNYEAHFNHFTKLAAAGAHDVVHFTISSGLSPTKDVAAKAADDVRRKYPHFRVYVVDPLTATVGQGALVMIAVDCRNRGMSAKDTHALCTSIRTKIQHFIVAGNLTYLKKGGRISSATAMLGSMLNIKPIISFDNEGKLFQLAKVKGTRKAISFIKEKMEREGPDPAYNYVFIVHTDCEGPANELAQYVRDRFGIEPHVSIMGPVIGSHVGPDAFALGYLSTVERNTF